MGAGSGDALQYPDRVATLLVRAARRLRADQQAVIMTMRGEPGMVASPAMAARASHVAVQKTELGPPVPGFALVVSSTGQPRRRATGGATRRAIAVR
jgi:hypothetical protein